MHGALTPVGTPSLQSPVGPPRASRSNAVPHAGGSRRRWVAVGGHVWPEPHHIGVVIVDVAREERLEHAAPYRPVPEVASAERDTTGMLADLAPLESVAHLAEVVLELDRAKTPRRARHAIGVAHPAAAGTLARSLLGGARLGDVLGDRKAAAGAGRRPIGDVSLTVGAAQQHGSRRLSRTLVRGGGARDPLAPMLLVFEVHLAPGCDGGGILSDEALASTRAQIMTLEEAAAVGFAGSLLQQGPQGADRVRLIAVADRDRGFISSALERSHEVSGFRVHEVAT